MKLEITEVIKTNGDIFFHVRKDGNYVSTGCFYAGNDDKAQPYRDALADARLFVDRILSGIGESKKTIWSIEVDQDESSDD